MIKNRPMLPARSMGERLEERGAIWSLYLLEWQSMPGYVGLTVNGARARLANHCSKVRAGANPRSKFTRWLLPILERGEKPSIRVLSEYRRYHEACQAETETILRLKAEGFALANRYPRLAATATLDLPPGKREMPPQFQPSKRESRTIQARVAKPLLKAFKLEALRRGLPVKTLYDEAVAMWLAGQREATRDSGVVPRCPTPAGQALLNAELSADRADEIKEFARGCGSTSAAVLSSSLRQYSESMDLGSRPKALDSTSTRPTSQG
jgi:hypothetical protein